MRTAARGFPAFLRSLDLPEPGELRRVARVYVWGRWFVLSIATFAWLYPLNVDEVVHAPNVTVLPGDSGRPGHRIGGRLQPSSGRTDAETTHTPHQRDPRLPRRLP